MTRRATKSGVPATRSLRGGVVKSKQKSTVPQGAGNVPGAVPEQKREKHTARRICAESTSISDSAGIFRTACSATLSRLSSRTGAAVRLVADV